MVKRCMMNVKEVLKMLDQQRETMNKGITAVQTILSKQ